MRGRGRVVGGIGNAGNGGGGGGGAPGPRELGETLEGVAEARLGSWGAGGGGLGASCTTRLALNAASPACGGGCWDTFSAGPPAGTGLPGIPVPLILTSSVFG